MPQSPGVIPSGAERFTAERAPGTQRPHLSRTLLVAGGLIVLCLVLYANALPNAFLFDDLPIIEQNQRVREGHLWALVSEQYWTEAQTDRLYRPLVSLSYGFNWALSQSPWAFRLPNILLHGAVCVLVFLLTRDVFREFAVALAAAFFFAIHPIHTEPLNTIVGRADLLATLFSLWAAWIWWHDAGRDHSSGWRRPVAAAILFAAAMLSKESALTLVLVMLLLDGYGRVVRAEGSHAGWWRVRFRRCYAPMLVVLVVCLGLRFAVLGQLTSSGEINRLENPIRTPAEMLAPGDSAFLVRWATPLVALAKSAVMMVWPMPLRHDYSYPAFPEIRRWTDPRFVGAVLLGALLVAAVIAAAWRDRRWLVAIGMWFAPYAIVANVLVIIGTVFGERLLYAPSVGACMGLGLVFGGTYGAMRTPMRRRGWGPRWWAVPVLVVLSLASIGAVYRVVTRNREWRSAETLLASVPDDGRASFKVIDSFGKLAIQEGRYDDALEYAERAHRLAPEAWGPVVRAGLAYYYMKDHDKARDLLRHAVSRLGGGGDATALLVLAELESEVGRDDNAIRCLVTMVRLRPDLPEGFNNLAVKYIRTSDAERIDQAVEYARKAVRMEPQQGAFHDTLAQALLADGKPDEALTHADIALGKLPHIGEVHWTLIRALHALDRREEELRAARAALDSIPPDDRFRAQIAARAAVLENGAP
jgi:Tfp pilus assembly protein PilF